MSLRQSELLFTIILFLINVLRIRGFTYYEDVGMYYKYHMVDLNWFEAKKVCESEGGTLAMPRYMDEAELLVSNFTKYKDYVHIGFHKLYSDNNQYHYVALDGKPLQYYYNLWEDGQPNAPGSQKCGLLRRSVKIHDGICDSRKTHFFCQKESPQTRIPKSDINCPIDDSEYRYAKGTGKCFKIHMNPMGYSSAAALCKAEGGNLAIFRNMIEENFVKNMFNELKYTYSYPAAWKNNAIVGINNIFDQNQYISILNEDLEYINWANGCPNNPVGERCVSMRKSGQLDDYSCNESLFFICELKAYERVDSDAKQTESFGATATNVMFKYPDRNQIWSRQTLTSENISSSMLEILATFNSTVYNVYNLFTESQNCK